MSQYDGLLDQAERKYGLPSGLLHGLMRTESGGNPNAVSSKGAVGLMQFMPATAKQFGIDPRDPAQAIDGAARYMAQNLKASNGDVAEALRLYQGGPNKAARGPQNAAYAGKVLGSMPGDSGDLAAMGFGKPQSADAPDLSSAGLSATPDDEVKKARDELDAITTVTPAAAQTHSAINSIIDQGLKAKASREDIKNAVYSYQAANGIDPTKTKGIDAYIDYRQNGGKGAAPVLNTAKVIPLTRTQKALAGLKQGVQDVDATFDPMAQAIARHAPFLDTIGNKLGFASADDVADLHARDRALFSGALGDDTIGNVGRIGGNVAASAPLVMGGNMLARRAAALAPEALAPVTNFIAGRAGGSLATRAASVATHGAAEGTMGAAAVSGGNDAPLSEQLEEGAGIGALLGPGGKLVAKLGGAAVGALAPKVNPIVAQLAQKAVDAGIDLRGSQISGSPFIKTVDSVLARVPGSGIAADNAAQREQFTRAVGRTFGADAPALTPDVMSAAKQNISKVYKDVSARTQVQAGPELTDALDQIHADAQGVLDTNKIPALKKLIANVRSKIGPDGTISGDAFQALTNKGSMLDKATQDGNSSFANAAKEIKANLNAALEASATPEDAAALSRADWQWKNMRTVEKLIANSPDNQIDPARLNRPVSTSFKNRAYTGAGDLGDLADIGQRFLKDQSSSNTAERGQIINALLQHGSGVAGGIGSLLGYHAGLDPLYAAGAGVGVAAGTSAISRGVGKVLSNDIYRNRLIAAALNDDKTGGVVAPWLSENFVPLAVAGSNRLLSNSTPSSR